MKKAESDLIKAMHEKNPTIMSGGFVIGQRSNYRKGSAPMSASPLHEASHSDEQRQFMQSGGILSSGNDNQRYDIVSSES